MRTSRFCHCGARFNHKLDLYAHRVNCAAFIRQRIAEDTKRFSNRRLQRNAHFTVELPEKLHIQVQNIAIRLNWARADVVRLCVDRCIDEFDEISKKVEKLLKLPDLQKTPRVDIIAELTRGRAEDVRE